jgi:myo-inositol-1(or 4)-monophosphatase
VFNSLQEWLRFDIKSSMAKLDHFGSKKFLADLRAIIEDAGQIITRTFGENIQIEDKSDGTPVTEVDRKIDKALKSALTQLVPEAYYLSEENLGGEERLGREFVWIVDPLDGTNEFINGIEELCVSVGLIYEGKTIAGGVLNPLTQEGGVSGPNGRCQFWGFDRYHAVAGSLQTSLITVSRTEDGRGLMAPLWKHLPPMTPIGSIAYKLLRVAGGRDDLTFTIEGRNEWDICGGAALLNSCGKILSRFDEKPMIFNQQNQRIPCGLVAGSKDLVRECLPVLRRELGY